MTLQRVTNSDKARIITDLILTFGECVEQDNSTQHKVYDLKGAGRVESDQQGQRRDVRILARGAEFEARIYRGQIGEVEMIRGGENALDRVFRNATTQSAAISAARKAEERARIGALPRYQR